MRVLLDFANDWRDCRRIASEWSDPRFRHRAERVRRFMIGCGIDIAPTGPYSWHVVRFVKTFQLCLILDGLDVSGRFDYRNQPLDVDGKAGPLTLLAMTRSERAGFKAWRHLSWHEMAVKDPNGKRPTTTNPVIYSQREPVLVFAEARTLIGGPLDVASWFRTWSWHILFSRSTMSQHLTGNGFDFSPHPSLTESVLRRILVKILGADVGGVGVDERWVNGRRIRIIGPSHVDCRRWRARWHYLR